MKRSSWNRIASLLIVLALLGVFNANAQDTTDIPDLEDILNLTIDDDAIGLGDKEFGDKYEKEVPSITSIITRDDIETYGAKDLSEILRLVPGFEFGIDVAGIIGTTYRGVNVHEGKQLLMVNGLTMNELAYGNTSNIGTMPAAGIERIEIIRGPGSVGYGGFAGLTVINIITRKAEINGAEINTAGGIVGNGGSFAHGSISAGVSTKTVKIAANASYQNQTLSTRPYIDVFGSSYDMNQENSYRKWDNAFIKVEAKGLEIDYNHTSFSFAGHDAFVDIIPIDSLGVKEHLNNTMDVVGARYNYNVTPFIKIKPYVELSSGNAIASSDFGQSLVTFDFQTRKGVLLRRYKGGILNEFDFKRFGTVVVGFNYYLDEANNRGLNGEDGMWQDAGADASLETTTRKRTSSFATMLQYNNLINDYIGMTGGIRYETTTFGDAFAPRLGLTFIKDNFSSKLLYGSAFRIPLPWQQYNLFLYAAPSPIELKPETSQTLELELGYKLSKYLEAKVNSFYVAITDPIVFIVDKYINQGDIQTLGVEGQLTYKHPTYGGFANFSVAKPLDVTSAGFVTSDGNNFLGHPPLKLNFGAYYKLTDKFKLSPSFTFLGTRYAQDKLNDVSIEYPTVSMLNVNAVYKGIANGLMDVGLYGANLLNSRYLLLQPYYGGHAPLPAQDRRLILSFTFHL